MRSLTVRIGQLFPHIATIPWIHHFSVWSFVCRRVDLTVDLGWCFGEAVQFGILPWNDALFYGETLITNLSWESRWEKESQKNTILYLKLIRQGTELLGCIFHEASVSNIRCLFSSGSRWAEPVVQATSQVMERWPVFPIANVSCNINTTFKEWHQKNWLFAGLNISTHTQHCAACATNAFNEIAVMLGKHRNYYHNNDGKNQTFIQWQTLQLGFLNNSHM